MERSSDQPGLLVQASTPRSIGFLDIPAELRVKVHRNLLVVDFDIEAASEILYRLPRRTSMISQILRTCSLCFHEGIGILYEENTCQLICKKSAEKSFATIGQASVNHIQHVSCPNLAIFYPQDGIEALIEPKGFTAQRLRSFCLFSNLGHTSISDVDPASGMLSNRDRNIISALNGESDSLDVRPTTANYFLSALWSVSALMSPMSCFSMMMILSVSRSAIRSWRIPKQILALTLFSSKDSDTTVASSAGTISRILLKTLAIVMASVQETTESGKPNMECIKEQSTSAKRT
ncbi:hypothetical protein EJ08DRAFT_351699 [Tothia fuscella]|uniref:Uncharacterized protein n=1 Tax=Tothia fuscella TaxID=1048955 RepID=A0A9P4NMV1_9PEZI|nr:hypothetical protein EJ08DRAFT_351699 [Tothia fuscella]